MTYTWCHFLISGNVLVSLCILHAIGVDWYSTCIIVCNTCIVTSTIRYIHIILEYKPHLAGGMYNVSSI